MACGLNDRPSALGSVRTGGRCIIEFPKPQRTCPTTLRPARSLSMTDRCDGSAFFRPTVDLMQRNLESQKSDQKRARRTYFSKILRSFRLTRHVSRADQACQDAAYPAIGPRRCTIRALFTRLGPARQMKAVWKQKRWLNAVIRVRVLGTILNFYPLTYDVSPNTLMSPTGWL